MRKAAVLLLSVVAVMMIVGVVITQSLLVLQRVASVEAARGQVWIRQRGHQEFMPLAGRARVAAGDMIKTGPNSHLDLHWVDNTRMRIGPNARVKVLKSQYNGATHADTAMFKLDLGRVWIRILKVLSQKSKFEVITPTATAGVRGTIFSVEVRPDKQTVVSVREGKVAVNEAGAHQEVTQGAMSSAGAVQPQNGAEQELWENNAEVTGPHLEIAQPVSGTQVKPGQAVQTAGTAERGASVTVNGQPQTLKLQKRFSTSVQAPDNPGAFSVTIEATDRRGIATRRVVTLEVTR